MAREISACGDERPRGVVDQHDVRRLRGERLEAGMHRGLARRAAMRRRLVAQLADRLVEHRGVVGIEHRLHRKDLWMARKTAPSPARSRVRPPIVRYCLGRRRRREARDRRQR